MMRQATYKTAESEQFMRDFYKEISEKKTVARGAKYRKGGSKSKKCSMSTDHMTQKQWKERNGPVMSYAMNQPTNFKDFKKMPTDVKKMYIEALHEKYNASQVDLAEMFGVHPGTVRIAVKELGLNKLFHRGGKLMDEEQKKLWRQFIGTDEPEQAVEQTEEDIQDEEQVAEAEEPVVRQLEEPCQNADFDAEEVDNACVMRDFAVRFTGKIDVDMIANSLRTILGTESVGSIKVIYTANANE